MSVHMRCPQRIANTCAHRTVWRRRGVRYYASGTTSDPDWFQQVRTELLSRKPLYQREELDNLHHEQLLSTLTEFAPRLPQLDGGARPNVPLAQLLTRFNIRVASSKLLPDGTDPLHSPGEPWMRRMWAGGSVQVNPALKLKSETPFTLSSRTACLERIKDVRLQGEGETAKIFVTIERRFASIDQLREAAGTQFGGDARKYIVQQVDDGVEWGNAWVKEERKLVFLKPKTAAELLAIQTGQTLAPAYLNSPTSPDFSHTLTPTRSLLFRYSALTFNAHLLHLDPTYTRIFEGHRNLLVHGPLTLTLMLQTLNKHLWDSRSATNFEMVESIEYRNLAPLYCDEEMHICAKKKKETDRGTTWDVWIEGPTGGMAVKAVMRTVARAKENYFANSMAKTITSTKLPDVQTVAAQAQDKLNALDQNNSSPEQLSQFSREERRKLWREEQRGKRREEKQPSSTPPSRELVPFSKVWREQWIGKHLQYLYRWENSPLITRTTLPVRDSIALSPTLGKTNSDDHQILQANMAAQTPTVRMIDSIPDVGTTESSPDALETADPSSSASLEKKPKTKRPAQRASRQKKKSRLVIKKVEQVSVRKVADHGLSNLQNEGSSKRVMEQKRSALRRAVQVANKERSAKDGSEEKSNG